MTTTIAGIAIPDSPLADDATQFVRDTERAAANDHSRRVFLWGALIGAEWGLSFDAELLYVGAMFHDIGLVEGHRSPDERFEIDGALTGPPCDTVLARDAARVAGLWGERVGVVRLGA